MRTILAPVERHARIETTLETALRLARLFDAHIEGVAAPHDLRLLVPTDAPGGVVFADQAPEAYAREEETCHAIHERAMRLGGARRSRGAVPEPAGDENEDAPPEAITCGWAVARAGGGDAALGAYARVFDVTVVGRPGATSADPRMGLLEAVLFESGRPIMIAPPEPPLSLDRCVAIDWNGAPETARAVAFARPLLARAEVAAVLSIAGRRGPEPDAGRLVRHLRRNSGRLKRACWRRPTRRGARPFSKRRRASDATCW